MRLVLRLHLRLLHLLHLLRYLLELRPVLHHAHDLRIQIVVLLHEGCVLSLQLRDDARVGFQRLRLRLRLHGLMWLKLSGLLLCI